MRVPTIRSGRFILISSCLAKPTQGGIDALDAFWDLYLPPGHRIRIACSPFLIIIFREDQDYIF